MAVVYDTGDYHSVSADHADFTLPDGDWSWLVIIRPDTETGGQDILSTGEWGTAGTYNFYQFDTVLGFKYEATTEREVVTISSGSWQLAVAQRSGGNLTLRSIPMGGSTVTSSASLAISGSVNPSLTLHMGRRADNGDAPFSGALSDAMFIPGQTISDADMQAIATGTAIDSFSWYSSRVFWNIADTSTQSDQTGNHTVTANGTLVSASDPVDLVRFGAQTVEVGQVTETNTAQAVSAFKAATIGIASETDSAFSMSSEKVATVGQVTESDTAQSVTPVKPIISTIGIASETDAAFAMSVNKTVTVGQVTESDTAQAVTLGGLIIGIASETDTALAMTPVKPIIQSVGQVTESNTAQAVTASHSITVGQATETDSVFSVTAVKPIFNTIGIASETDTALAMTVHKPKIVTVSQVTENNAAQGVSVVKSQVVIQVTESDTAQAVTVIKPLNITLNPATETNTAFAMSPVKIVTAGQVVESNLAWPVSISVYFPVIPTNAGSNFYMISANSIDDAASLAATSTASGFDVDNLQLNAKSKIWRSTSTAAQTLTATWSAAQNISAVALAFTNLGRSSTVRIKLYTNIADSDPVYDSEDKTIEYAYPNPHGFSTNGLSAFAYGGGTYFSHLFQTQQIKKLEIIITDSSNQDGYVEVSRVIAGKAFTPTYGAQYGASVAHVDTSNIMRTDSGDIISNRGTISKSIPFSLAAMNPLDRRELMEMIRYNGAVNPVFVSLYENSNNPEEKQTHLIYGVFESIPSPSISSFDKYNSNVTITEI